MAESLRFRCDSLADSANRTLAFRSEEELGRPYRFRAWVDTDSDALASDDVLGQRGTVWIDEQPFHGIVCDNELLLATGARRIHLVTLMPDMGKLGYAYHSRVFVDQSVPEIIEQVLGKGGVSSYELRLSGDHPKRHHVCQYRESDLDFLQRWMEREGIYYYFAQGDGAAKLVIADGIDGHDQLPAGLVRYVASREDGAAREYLKSWRRHHQAAIADVSLDDYDYLKPALALGEPMSTGAVGFDSFTRFEDNLQDGAEAKRIAQVAAQRQAAKQVRYHGEGCIRGLHVGHLFELDEHPRDALNQKYLACRVVHELSRIHADPALGRYLGVEVRAGENAYRVTVEAIASDVPFRLERRAVWPTVAGVEIGRVDGEADGPYAQIDAEGRYRVRFLFDENGAPAGGASAWLRMSQPHGGSPEGFHFPLRKGTEVMLGFVHGDPDRPYIVGAIPNPQTPSPVTRNNHTQNVLQTGSKNRVEIEDKDGSQYIDISTPPQKTFVHLGVHAGLGDHNIVVATDGDGLHHAGGVRDITVGGEQTEDVTGDLSEEYASNQTTHVSGAFTETIDAGKKQTIAGGSTQTIDGGLVQTISGGETRSVDGGLTETIDGSRTQSIVGSTSETIGGSLSQTVTGAINITTPATYGVTAPPSITMITPANALVSGTGGVKIVAPAGHMVVDSFMDGIGQNHFLQYFLKITIGMLRIAMTAMWYRKQLAHLAAYGVKVDLRGVDDKAVADDKKFGALQVQAAAAKAKKAALTQKG